MDVLLGAENNVDNIDDAAADDDHDNRGTSGSHEKTARKRFKRHRKEQTQELQSYNNKTKLIILFLCE